ncbi:TPA: hypothetical protein ACSP8C_004222 [Aeromonas veronii]
MASEWGQRLSITTDLLDKEAVQELNSWFDAGIVVEGEENKNIGDFQLKVYEMHRLLELFPSNNVTLLQPLSHLVDEYIDLICALLVKFNYSSSSIEEEHVNVLKRVMSSFCDVLKDVNAKPDAVNIVNIRSKLNFIYKEKEKIESINRARLSSLINDSVAAHSKRVEVKVNSIRNDATHKFNDMMNENLQVILKVEENANILRALENRIRDVLDKATWLPDAADEVINKAKEKLSVLTSIENNCKIKEESIDSSFRISNTYSMGRAFKERGDILQSSIKRWVGVFILSLISIPFLILWLCDFDLTQLSADYKASLARMFIILPSIWLAWFSAKQYAHSSKLKEDYEYKLAMAKAYEAYKQEAASHSDEMMGMLLKNSLDKITENPVRLYSAQDNNTPITELLSKFTPEQLLEIIKAINIKQTK